MKRDAVPRPKLRRTVGPLLLPIALGLGGCQPVSGEILSQFILDLTREALAAWLL